MIVKRRSNHSLNDFVLMVGAREKFLERVDDPRPVVSPNPLLGGLDFLVEV